MVIVDVYAFYIDIDFI